MEMADGLIFYWTSWLLWSCITFFMPKNRTRTLLAICVLISIICSNMYINVSQYQIALSFCFLMIIITWLYAKLPKTLNHILGTFSITIGYAAIQIWYISSPLSLFIADQLLISTFMTLLIYLIVKHLNNQLIIGLFGMAFGEILYSFITSSYNITHSIGGMAFFDSLSCVVLLILLLEIVKQIRQWITKKIQPYNDLLNYTNEKRPKIVKTN